MGLGSVRLLGMSVACLQHPAGGQEVVQGKALLEDRAVRQAQALLQSGGSPSPDKLLELAQVAEDSMLDAGSGKALSDFLVKNTSKRLLFYTLRWLGRCCGA